LFGFNVLSRLSKRAFQSRPFKDAVSPVVMILKIWKVLDLNLFVNDVTIGAGLGLFG